MGSSYRKTNEVIQHFKANKCYVAKHGTNHDFWENPENGGHTRLIRGSKGPGKNLYFNMCKDLGIRP